MTPNPHWHFSKKSSDLVAKSIPYMQINLPLLGYLAKRIKIRASWPLQRLSFYMVSECSALVRFFMQALNNVHSQLLSRIFPRLCPFCLQPRPFHLPVRSFVEKSDLLGRLSQLAQRGSRAKSEFSLSHWIFSLEIYSILKTLSMLVIDIDIFSKRDETHFYEN